jgi:hypothetical protein
LSAWPPVTIVTKQVVPSLPTLAGSAASTATAASSARFAASTAKARIAAALARSGSLFAD